MMVFGFITKGQKQERLNGTIILKKRRPRIVTEEEFGLANRKRLEHKVKLDSRKIN